MADFDLFTMLSPLLERLIGSNDSFSPEQKKEAITTLKSGDKNAFFNVMLQWAEKSPLFQKEGGSEALQQLRDMASGEIYKEGYVSPLEKYEQEQKKPKPSGLSFALETAEGRKSHTVPKQNGAGR